MIICAYVILFVPTNNIILCLKCSINNQSYACHHVNNIAYINLTFMDTKHSSINDRYKAYLNKWISTYHLTTQLFTLLQAM